MSPVGLDQLLDGLSQSENPSVLVGFDKSDDAGVYRLDDHSALVTTADIITPPLDDPYLFGQIAAANSISDIYAMGGHPITCLNLAAFPAGKLGTEVLDKIMRGALSKISEAGAALVGGHTIDDEEPKFGLAVNGLVHPDRIWHNGGAQPGDALLLTKPVGSGVLFNANRKKRVSSGAMQACIENAVSLNGAAAAALETFTVHAATDVTGFGLAGHLFEMIRDSEISVRIRWSQVPILSEAPEMYRRGVTTGMNASNWQRVKQTVQLERGVPESCPDILVDPQTSGGLLVALPQEEAEDALRAIHQAGACHASRIGEIEKSPGASITIAV